MSFRKPQLALIARVALLAMCWQLLLPLSAVLAAQEALPGEVPVCTASGIKWIKVGEQAPDQGKQTERNHCPLCLTGQGATVAIQTAPAFDVPSTQAVEHRPTLSAAFIYAFAHGAPPPARAPPIAS